MSEKPDEREVGVLRYQLECREQSGEESLRLCACKTGMTQRRTNVYMAMDRTQRGQSGQ